MRKPEVFLTGSATVYCPHDRLKREVTDPDYVKFLGRVAGYEYDPKLHKLQWCPCCENLFVAADDTPRLCTVCVGDPLHALGGPLPKPQGVIE